MVALVLPFDEQRKKILGQRSKLGNHPRSAGEGDYPFTPEMGEVDRIARGERTDSVTIHDVIFRLVALEFEEAGHGGHRGEPLVVLVTEPVPRERLDDELDALRGDRLAVAHPQRRRDDVGLPALSLIHISE